MMALEKLCCLCYAILSKLRPQEPLRGDLRRFLHATGKAR
nr:MAG TPA: hypothetical protein [Bacteriophage sp.]